MRYTLILNPAAVEDVEEAKAWYDGQRDGLGDEFAEEVDRTIARVRRQPLVHAPIRQDVRRAFVARFPYLVFYRVIGRHIAVVAVRHGRSDPRGWQSRI